MGDRKDPDASRAQAVFVRRHDEVGAMAWDDRLMKRVRNFFRGGTEAGDADEEAGEKAAVQYRLEATDRNQNQSLMTKILTCGIGGYGRSSMGAGGGSNQKLAMYLHWMFRTNFVFLFFSMCAAFFAWVILFAGFIAVAGNMDPSCVRIGSAPYDAANTGFADAFALSWTTFSTVGYGSTYPAVSNQSNNRMHCFWISFLCSLEALVGVLYAGFCGAILFGKVLRIQSHAQVVFSDPLVIRYGPGLLQGNANHSGDEDEGTEKKNPFPVLEFRVVNRLFNELGGEIMDATLNVVANVDAHDTDTHLPDSLDSHNLTDSARSRQDSSHTSRSRQGSTNSRVHQNSRTRQDSATETVSDSGSLNDSLRGSESVSSSLHRFFDPFIRHRHQTVVEDPSHRLVGKHVFSKMHIEAGEHPFFKRVWLARHVLDDHSPILKPRIRRQIRRNGGTWPDRLNSFTAIRDCLQFNQILVSLNGVSNVSASTVYKQKIYDFVDVNIGYEFVNLLYREPDGSLGVDLDLINDVREQSGGGGEPLMD